MNNDKEKAAQKEAEKWSNPLQQTLIKAGFKAGYDYYKKLVEKQNSVKDAESNRGD